MNKKMANKILAAALSLGAVMNNGGIGSAMESKKEEKTSNSQNRDEILDYGLRYGKKGLNLLRENFGFKDIIGLLALYKIHRDVINHDKAPLGLLMNFVRNFDIDDSSSNFAACDAAKTMLKYYNNEHSRKLLLETFVGNGKYDIYYEKMKKENELNEEPIIEEPIKEVKNENNIKLDLKDLNINKKLMGLEAGEENAIKIEKVKNLIEEKKPAEWAEQRASVLSFLFRNFKFEEIYEYTADGFIYMLEDVSNDEKVFDVKDWKYCVAKAKEFLKFNQNKLAKLGVKNEGEAIIKKDDENENNNLNNLNNLNNNNPNENPNKNDNPNNLNNNPNKAENEAEKLKKQQELEKAQKEYEELFAATQKLEGELKGLEGNEEKKDDIAKKTEALEANKAKLEELKLKIEELNKVELVIDNNNNI